MLRWLAVLLCIFGLVACNSGSHAGSESASNNSAGSGVTALPSSTSKVAQAASTIGSDVATPDATSPVADASPVTAIAVEPLEFVTGRNDYTIVVDGRRREFIVQVPRSYVAGQPAPLVFIFHGTSQDGEKFWNDSGWKEKGEAEGIITVYPTALRYFVTDDNRTTTKWTYADIESILRPDTEVHDDVEFTRSMLDRIHATWTIDSSRIYATGFSNGGSFVESRLLMEMPDVFASFAVAGSGALLPSYEVSPSEKTPQRSLYILFGTNDDKLFGNPTAIASGIAADFPSTPEEFLAHPYIQGLFGRWFGILNLSTTYSVEYGRPPQLTLTFADSLGDSPNELRMRIVQGMFHIYPGPDDENRVGFKACDLFWDFFSEHTLGN